MVKLQIMQSINNFQGFVVFLNDVVIETSEVFANTSFLDDLVNNKTFKIGWKIEFYIERKLIERDEKVDETTVSVEEFIGLENENKIIALSDQLGAGV